MRSAIYAFSGDPITFGHIDIIKRAAAVFDRVLVAIGVNQSKHYLFSQAERVEMARKSLSIIPNVEVKSFQGMLVDFAYEHNIDVIVKGVRSSKDFEYEFNLHTLGESQNLNSDTFVLFAKPSLAHVSSSAVKEIQIEQGLIHDYVSSYVKQCLEAKLSDQYIVGLTGEIGAGKSFVAKALADLAQAQGLNAHVIELDQIAWQIQSDLQAEKYVAIRKEIGEFFGPEVVDADGSINRKVLGELVFSDSDKLAQLNTIMETPILVRLRKELMGKKGLIFITAALLAEANMIQLVNHTMILVHADKEIQKQRLLERGLDAGQIKRRLESQYDTPRKQKQIEQAIAMEGTGQLWLLDNTRDSSQATKNLLVAIRAHFKI